MNDKNQPVVLDAKLSSNGKCLTIRTQSNLCNYLRAQLIGQLLSDTEGRNPIQYVLPEDPPESCEIDIKADIENMLLLVDYLEKDLEDDDVIRADVAHRLRCDISNILKKNSEVKKNPMTVFFSDKSMHKTAEEPMTFLENNPYNI